MSEKESAQFILARLSFARDELLHSMRSEQREGETYEHFVLRWHLAEMKARRVIDIARYGA